VPFEPRLIVVMKSCNTSNLENGLPFSFSFIEIFTVSCGRD